MHKTNNVGLNNWENTPIFKNFVSPWSEQPFGETTFQYQNDTIWFYFLFKVIDKDIQLCDTSFNDELNVLQSDRVELFFAKDSLMQPYYTFEMDAAGRLFDARCSIISKNKKLINDVWDIDKKELQFTTVKISNGYALEGKIAMSFLRNAQLFSNNKLWCGIQRANFSATNLPQWICAKDPLKKQPNFHCWDVFVELYIDRRK